MHLSVTIVIIAVTCITSFLAFSNEKLKEDLIFYPPAINKQNQWYRFITCGFIHADITHLLFNMYSFYMFGEAVETAFTSLFGEKGRALYIVLYVSSLVVCLLPTYQKNIDNYYYRSLGASGAVSAVIFAFIFMQPMTGIGLMFIPIPFPAFIFGAVYLIVTAILDKKGGGNINHSAHLWGAVYGIAFFIICCNFLSSYHPVQEFVEQVKYYFQSKFS